MKAINILSAFLFISCIGIGCKEKTAKEKEAEYLNNVVSKIGSAGQYKWVVILPGLGCHGCIQEGEAFMQKNIGNKNIYFVLTKVESLKILQNKINVKVQDHTNIFLDKDNAIRIPSDNNIYPCIIQMNGENLKDYQFQAPYNSQAFAKLEALLAVK